MLLAALVALQDHEPQAWTLRGWGAGVGRAGGRTAVQDAPGGPGRV